jgi:hypothetical protein
MPRPLLPCRFGDRKIAVGPLFRVAMWGHGPKHAHGQILARQLTHWDVPPPSYAEPFIVRAQDHKGCLLCLRDAEAAFWTTVCAALFYIGRQTPSNRSNGVIDAFSERVRGSGCRDATGGPLAWVTEPLSMARDTNPG